MENKVEYLSSLRITPDGEKVEKDVVVREVPLTIFLNRQEIITLMCTPDDLEDLALGFLYSEGLIENKEEIDGITLGEEEGSIRIELKDKSPVNLEGLKKTSTSGCGKGGIFLGQEGKTKKVESKLKVSLFQVLSLVREMEKRSSLFRKTGGVHCAALAEKEKILIYREDVGRHNAVDKVIGNCFREGLTTSDKIIITSGRLSSDLSWKAGKAGIPVVVSRTAPTSLGARLAQISGITLIGFARGRRMNIYTHSWRISR